MRYSIVNYADIEPQSHRLDSQYYQSVYLDAEELLKSQRWSHLGELVDDIESFGAYDLCNYISYQEEGIPYLRAVDFQEGFVSFAHALRIDEESHELLWKSEIQPDTVLVTMSGTVGRAALAMRDWAYPINSSQDVAKIVVRKQLDPAYLTVFLNSRYGELQLRRLPVGSVQQHVFLWQLEKLIIPVFSDRFQQLIGTTYAKAHQAQTRCPDLYRQAEAVLIDELGLADWEPYHVVAFEASLDAIADVERLDASYFQPKFLDLVQRIKLYDGGWLSIGDSDSVHVKSKRFHPKDDAHYRYIELQNISDFGQITGLTEALGEDLPTRARRRVNAGDVIVSSLEGSISSTALITDELEGALCSTGFQVVNSSIINPATMLCLMKSIVGLQQLARGCSGSILPAINQTDFKKIVLPKVSVRAQRAIQEKITRMYQSSHYAKHLLQLAETAVDYAVEGDTKTAGQWLTSKMHDLNSKDRPQP